jgi:S1-C subfamily serine protease
MSEQETTTQQLTATETPEPGFAAAEPPLESSPTDQPQSLPTPETHQKKRNQTWAAALVALLLVIASSGITYFVMAQDEGADAGEVSAPVAESPEDPSSDLVVPGEEPVADAAAVILPSVVQIQTGNGVGSGVIYDADGLILTAAHVVAGSETVIVRFEDGEEVEGNVLGGTSGADVAVIQVDRSGLPAADLALDQDPRVGQLAIAVGSPWGLQGTNSKRKG